MATRVRKHLQQRLFDAADRPAVIDGKVIARRQPKKKRRRTPGVKLGRPPKGPRSSERHETRPELAKRFPVHVVLRVHRDIKNLRKRYMYKALRDATISVALREYAYAEAGAFRIIHISIQRNHIHLLVEADHKVALSRGMQSFQISAAKHLNRAVSVERAFEEANGKAWAQRSAAERRAWRRTTVFKQAMAKRRRGSVFPDRFHMEIITNPKQARRALAYVLNNWRKHREDKHELANTGGKRWCVDPYSTGVFFDGWKEREHERVYMPYRDDYQPMVVYLPKTWLLCVGWRRHGLIPYDFVPSEKPLPARRQW